MTNRMVNRVQYQIQGSKSDHNDIFMVESNYQQSKINRLNGMTDWILSKEVEPMINTWVATWDHSYC